MTTRLAGLDTLTLNSRELAEDYFMPAQMAQRRAKQQAAAKPADSTTVKRDTRTPEQTQAMQAQRQVFTDLAQQKILRAVYSERQLNEVWSTSGSTTSTCSPAKGRTAISHGVRARRDSAARVRQVPRPARGNGEEPGDALLSGQLAKRRTGRGPHGGAEHSQPNQFAKSATPVRSARTDRNRTTAADGC